MKYRLITILILFGLVGVTAPADEIPQFYKDTLPEHAAAKMLEGWGVVQGEGAALDAKTRELVALAVAAQIPCRYCAYAHTAKARKLGASEAEIREAIAAAGYIRLWSTILNGNDYDYDKFTAEFDQLLGGS